MTLSDKIIEQERYNISSQKRNSINLGNELAKLGAENFSDYLKPPYLYYHRLISNEATKNTALNHLDLCCGDGIHSLTSAKLGANVVGIDYAENSINLAKERAKFHNLNVDFRSGDVESLPFSDSTFDIITCAGSMSYVDHEIFLNHVFRLLKDDGVFICVDSFNHNIFYRINRFIHFVKGERTYSTLKRMPNTELLKKINKRFKRLDVQYFGIFIFLAPFFRIFMNEKKLTELMNTLDRTFWLFKKYSFKVVIKAKK